jgi:hypothetical protein
MIYQSPRIEGRGKISIGWGKIPVCSTSGLLSTSRDPLDELSGADQYRHHKFPAQCQGLVAERR